jgi:hypothetical protein
VGTISTYAIKLPLARADRLLVQELDGETVVYDLESKQAHCLQALAAIVFAGADGTKSQADLAELAAYRLGTSVSEADVADAVAQLQHAGLLEVPLPVRLAGQDDGVSRREALRRVSIAGATVAFAAPLITSIAAPSAEAAGISGIPPGCTGCGKNSDCTSNHCCQSVPGKQCNASCCVGANNSCHGASCFCVGGSANGSACNTTTCPGGSCVCASCTVCSGDIGGCPSSCPSGTVSCCNPSC